MGAAMEESFFAYVLVVLWLHGAVLAVAERPSKHGRVLPEPESEHPESGQLSLCTELDAPDGSESS